MAPLCGSPVQKFCCVFRSHRCLRSAVSLNFWYGLRRFIRYLCIYEPRMSPILNGSSVIRHSKHSNVIEIHNELTFEGWNEPQKFNTQKFLHELFLTWIIFNVKISRMWQTRNRGFGRLKQTSWNSLQKLHIFILECSNEPPCVLKNPFYYSISAFRKKQRCNWMYAKRSERVFFFRKVCTVNIWPSNVRAPPSIRDYL